MSEGFKSGFRMEAQTVSRHSSETDLGCNTLISLWLITLFYIVWGLFYGLRILVKAFWVKLVFFKFGDVFHCYYNNPRIEKCIMLSRELWTGIPRINNKADAPLIQTTIVSGTTRCRGSNCRIIKFWCFLNL